jgi:hypothetical protein
MHPNESLGADTLGHLEGFLSVLDELYRTFTPSRSPTEFERGTALALWSAAQQAVSPTTPTAGKMVAVSSVTGGGKTQAAIALLAYMARIGKSGALLITELSEIENALESFRKLGLGELVAVGSSLHKSDADPATVKEYALKGVSRSGVWTEAEAKAALILISTHAAWRAEVEQKKDHGIYTLDEKILRSLVIVDEEPQLERAYEFQSATVGALADLLSSVDLAGDFRAHFNEASPAVLALRSIQRKCEAVMDSGRDGRKQLERVDLVTLDEAESISGVNSADIFDRLSETVPLPLRAERLRNFMRTLAALKAASQGRCFFSIQGSEFHAFDRTVPPRSGTILLDGTADLNGFYPLTPWIHVSPGPRADYSLCRATVTRFPKGINRKAVKPEKVNDSDLAAMWRWLTDFIVSVAEEGEEVLIYGWSGLRARTLALPGIDNPDHENWKGRRVHFLHFGEGRGTNGYKHCSVFVQLGEFVRPRAAYLKRLGSLDPSLVTDQLLHAVGANAADESLFTKVRDADVIANAKQNAARVVRNFDDDGRAKAVRLHFVEVDPKRFDKDRLEGMFPGINTKRPPQKVPPKPVAKRVAELFSETARTYLTAKDVQQLLGIAQPRLAEALKTEAVQQAVASRGWIEGKAPTGKRPQTCWTRTNPSTTEQET